MNFIDLALILLISGFVFFGLFFGFVRTLSGLIGTILGFFLTSWLIGPVSAFLGSIVSGSVGKVVLFVFIFFIVTRLIGIVFWLLGKVLGILAWIPFAGLLDRIVGAVFGFVEGIVFVGVGLYFILQYLPDDAVRATLAASVVGKYLLALVAGITALAG